MNLWYINYQVVRTARRSLTLSLSLLSLSLAIHPYHPSLLVGPMSTQSWCTLVDQHRCVGVHKRTLFMNSSLFLQQYMYRKFFLYFLLWYNYFLFICISMRVLVFDWVSHTCIRGHVHDCLYMPKLPLWLLDKIKSMTLLSTRNWNMRLNTNCHVMKRSDHRTLVYIHDKND